MHLLLTLALTALLTVEGRRSYTRYRTPEPMLTSPSSTPQLYSRPTPPCDGYRPLPPPKPWSPSTGDAYKSWSPPKPTQPQPTSGNEMWCGLEATLIERLRLPANSRLERAANRTTVRNTVKIKLRQNIGAALVYGSHIVAEVDVKERRLHEVGAEGLITRDMGDVPTRATLSGKQAIWIVATANYISDEDFAKAWNKQAILILYNNSHKSPSVRNSGYVSKPIRNGGYGSAQVEGAGRNSRPARAGRSESPPVQYGYHQPKPVSKDGYDSPAVEDGGYVSVPVLSYLVSFYVHPSGSSTPLAPHAVVNANNGVILASWNGLATAAVTMRLTGVGGNVGRWGLQKYDELQASVDPVSGLCQYNDDRLQVQNLKGATSGAFVPWSFDCGMAASQTFDAINGGYAPANDAAVFTRTTLDMYGKYVNNLPTTTPVRVRVHYGQNYENAFWDGTQVNIGDGRATVFPLSSLDLLAHEISHGFTASTSGLQLTGQSGCINEAFSDMAGEAAEFFRDGANDFVVGRNVVKAGGGIRWLCDPTMDGSSIDTAARYTAGMDPHRCSGVYNKAFCLLAKKPGWGTDSAFQVFAEANRMYWSQLSNMRSGLCCVQTAAETLGANVADVAAAFEAVGLSCSGSCPPRR